ncbi:hypothetical protein GUJ93_ZPchr0010g7805 [Zizania palustris]|uniref:Protein kinase domain-containing protein n=1 Tax=Zizania palustris TaxID=103762 RepID=A0A8J6BE04_ZIZPA|nr:hypothetical protein GUJ93_ZPchr0010g7805 [Zizania palustris]
MAATPPSSRDPSPQGRRPSSVAGEASKRGGLLLGRYKLGKILGHDTFAKVYQARNADTGETVTIKVLDKEKRRSGMASSRGGGLFSRVAKGRLKEDTAHRY